MAVYLIALFSGIALAVAFPQPSLSWLAWMGVAPLIYLTFRLRWKEAVICSLLFGVCFFGVLIYWIALFGNLPLIALTIAEGLFIVGFVVLAKAIGTRLTSWERLILLPSLWVSIEWIRSLGMFGFTWGDLGYSQYRNLAILQVASIGGIWGISFLMVLFSAAIAHLIGTSREIRRPSVAVPHLAVAVTLLAISVGFGYFALHSHGSRANKVTAAVLQGNISQDTGKIIDFANNSIPTYSRLTLEASKRRAAIVVWPETAVPGLIGEDLYLRNDLERLSRDSGSTLLVGGWDRDRNGRMYNSAFLISPISGLVDKSSKVHLVPFGEFVPARKYLPFLKYYRVRDQDTSPGKNYRVMEVGEYKIGTAICFESTFPEISRKLTASGANVLCFITDDEWFGKSPAAEQHLSKAVLRAVENGRYVLRGAATGESCIIDSNGRILCKKELETSGVLVADVIPLSQKTLYTRWGDWVVYLSLAISIFGIALSLSRRKQGTL